MSVINTDISRMKKDANELRLLAMKYNKKINCINQFKAV